MIQVYNVSVIIMSTLLVSRLTVELFGWYGRLDSREDRGELATTGLDPIRYIDYDEDLFLTVADSTELDPLTFRVNLKKKTVVTTTVTPVSEPPPLPINLLVGVGVGVVAVILAVLLVITLVCVFGRKKKKPNKNR